MILLKNFQNIIYIDEKFLKTRIHITLQHKRAEVGLVIIEYPSSSPRDQVFPYLKPWG